jgi:hypothetical protein
MLSNSFVEECKGPICGGNGAGIPEGDHMEAIERRMTAGIR